MNKYTDGKRIIYATEKAYNLIYKNQGFKEAETIDYEAMEYTELQALAKEKGLKSVGIKKEDLIKSLKEGE